MVQFMLCEHVQPQAVQPLEDTCAMIEEGKAVNLAELELYIRYKAIGYTEKAELSEEQREGLRQKDTIVGSAVAGSLAVIGARFGIKNDFNIFGISFKRSAGVAGIIGGTAGAVWTTHRISQQAARNMSAADALQWQNLHAQLFGQDILLDTQASRGFEKIEAGEDAPEILHVNLLIEAIKDL